VATFQPGPFDVIAFDGRYYLPFAPFPAVVLMPVVAIIGAVTADQVESGINATFTAPGFGMSVFLTSPGLLFASQADWRPRRSWWLLGATIAVLIPTLPCYGGGWLKYGYRYLLDSVPFVIALCGLTAAARGRIGLGWLGSLGLGTIVMGFAAYWVDKI